MGGGKGGWDGGQWREVKGLGFGDGGMESGRDGDTDTEWGLQEGSVGLQDGCVGLQDGSVGL